MLINLSKAVLNKCNKNCAQILYYYLLGFKGVNKKWRVVTRQNVCDNDKGLWPLWKDVFFLKDCNRLEGCAFLQSVVTFLKGCILFKIFWPLPFVDYKLREFLSFYYIKYFLSFAYISYKTKWSIVSVSVICCCHFEFV